MSTGNEQLTSVKLDQFLTDLLESYELYMTMSKHEIRNSWPVCREYWFVHVCTLISSYTTICWECSKIDTPDACWDGPGRLRLIWLMMFSWNNVLYDKSMSWHNEESTCWNDWNIRMIPELFMSFQWFLILPSPPCAFWPKKQLPREDGKKGPDQDPQGRNQLRARDAQRRQ